MTTQFIPLTDYSSKYRVSISTLRRRIKAEDIQFVFEEGKYLILDGPLSQHQRVHRPSLRSSDDTLMPAPTISLSENPMTKQSSPAPADEPVLAVANRLLTELKKAYSHILQEKEEQILHLRQELADLKTLVRVLESENERLSPPKELV